MTSTSGMIPTRVLHIDFGPFNKDSGCWDSNKIKMNKLNKNSWDIYLRQNYQLRSSIIKYHMNKHYFTSRYLIILIQVDISILFDRRILVGSLKMRKAHFQRARLLLSEARSGVGWIESQHMGWIRWLFWNLFDPCFWIACTRFPLRLNSKNFLICLGLDRLRFWNLPNYR